MENIVIFGSSGHAGVIANIIKRLDHNLLGFFDDFKEKGSTVFSGYKILGKIEDIKDYKDRRIVGIVGIGDNYARYTIYEKIQAILPNFKFITIIDPSAVVSETSIIGTGTVIMPGAIINNNTYIGDSCIVNTKASLDHDSNLGSGASLAPGVTTGGNVSIGSGTAISLGANIIHNISIGSYSVVGAGSLVLKDIPDFSVAYGVPAKVIRTRAMYEKYL